MKALRVDHLVLTVTNIEKTVAFYESVLGMEKVVFGDNRVALIFGKQKINLHQLHHEFEPKAQRVMPGSVDICFIVDTPSDEVVEHLKRNAVEIIEGPVQRTGALGAIDSVYFRDPDGNLIEVSTYLDR
ncbi:VOC family protein [Kistimonas asteriae]|uniref:VOC family protein n=1 Tax=Kistimonas asteriae TaxID=517724 RepID=UPI001BA6AB2B|nr:VOC family protein [Kistimonas asteriae]